MEWEHPGLGEDLAALVDSSSLRALALDGLEVTAAVVAAVAASVAAFRSAEVTVADLELPAAFLGKKNIYFVILKTKNLIHILQKLIF